MDRCGKVGHRGQVTWRCRGEAPGRERQQVEGVIFGRRGTVSTFMFKGLRASREAGDPKVGGGAGGQIPDLLSWCY